MKIAQKEWTVRFYKRWPVRPTVLDGTTPTIVYRDMIDSTRTTCAVSAPRGHGREPAVSKGTTACSYRMYTSTWRQVKTENHYNRRFASTPFNQVTWFRCCVVQAGIQLKFKYLGRIDPKCAPYNACPRAQTACFNWISLTESETNTSKNLSTEMNNSSCE